MNSVRAVHSKRCRSLSANTLRALTTICSLIFLSSCAGLSGSGAGTKGGGDGGSTTIPTAPMGVQATAGNAQVSLNWSASTDATSYHVKRATKSGGPYTQISAPMMTSFTDTALTNGTKYFYVISALDSAGESANSAEVNADPSSPASAPVVPANLQASGGNAEVTLTWSASAGATSYHVKRSTTSGGPYTQVSAPTATSFTDTGLTNGTKYFYVVSALDTAGESANSTQVGATPTAPLAPPSAPAGLQATAGNAQVALSWGAATGATSYHVKRSTTSGGPYTQVSAPMATSFTDAGLTNGTKYFYVVSALNASGESANSAQASATPAAPIAPPATPTGLQATAGNAQVSLTWTAATGATSYHLKRATTSGGPYTQISAPTATNFTETSLTNGTTYFYVVSALNTSGESSNSAQASATPTSPVSASIQVTVDALSDRHAISPYVYGVNFPSNSAYITDSGATLIRWGGNASTRYNWTNFDTSAASDWYFSNRPFGNSGDPLYNDSTQFVSNVSSAGGYPIMTIGMLPWAAKDASNYSFSVSKYGAQCATNPFSADDGNGVKSDCSTNVTGNDPHDANIALLDGPPASGDPAGSVYRSEWVTALSSAYPGTRPHFYDMDNEVDIWSGTHRDVHPAPSGYNELRDTYLRIATGMKTWDPQAVRFGPVSCCWWFYWNGANGNDKAEHGGVDFLPWWLNEIYWSDLASGTRSVDAFDIHAYPDQPDNFSSFTTAQKRAAAVRIFRDYWDPTYVSESGDINQPWATQIQPLKTIAFRIPRIRAMLNMIYPGTPLSITEWNAAFAGESDFSTAIADADAFGIFGRERVTYATRWTAADSTAPAYQSLKLFRNYDGNHSTFGVTSVSATHNADPNLFSVYAALSASQTSMTLLVINKDPANAANVGFALNNFTPSSVQAFTLSSSSPTAIVASGSKSWNSVQSFALYSVTLLVIAGKLTSTPAAEWDLNPDAMQVAASSTVALAPKIVSSNGASVTLQSAQFDSGSTNGGTISITSSQLTSGGDGAITITSGATPGFYHFTVTAQDSAGVLQKQGGWLVVGNPAASLAKTGDNQTGGPGKTLQLSVTLNPGASGGTNSGASILFTTDAGTLNGSARQVVTTNSSGVAAVTLTLPSSGATIHVTAEGPYGLGHPVVTFTEVAQ